MNTKIKRIAKLLLSASLPEAVVERLAMKYGERRDFVEEIDEYCLHSMVTHPHTVVEWVLRNMSSGDLRWPEDQNRVVTTANFFFKNNNTPKWREILNTVLDRGTALSRNIFSYTLQDLEECMDSYIETSDSKAEKDRLNKLQSLPPGAELVYNKNGMQCVKVTKVEAACALGRGTKWCTSSSDTAQYYLDHGPLYVVYKVGKKYAQFHIDFRNDQFQIMDVQDRVVEIDDSIKEILIGIGLWYDVLKIQLKSCHFDSDNGIESDSFSAIYKERDPEFEEMISDEGRSSWKYAVFFLHDRFPEGEPAIIEDGYAVSYARLVIKGPWPEAEPFIAKEGQPSYDYFRDVTQDRFQLGEPAMLREHFFEEYLYYLQKLRPARIEEIFEDYKNTKYYPQILGYVNDLKKVK